MDEQPRLRFTGTIEEGDVLSLPEKGEWRVQVVRELDGLPNAADLRPAKRRESTMRPMFTLYVVLIAGGLALHITVGLAHLRAMRAWLQSNSAIKVVLEP